MFQDLNYTYACSDIAIDFLHLYLRYEYYILC